MEDNGYSIIATFQLPKIEENDFPISNSVGNFSEMLQRLAEIAAFTKSKTEENPLMKQKLQLPFPIEQELEVVAQILQGHNFLKVVGKRFTKKAPKKTEFESRFAISELKVQDRKIVRK